MYKGTDKISQIYKGTKPVRRIYKGDTLVYKTIPSGYVEVEYLESSGTQYIDTGFKPKLDTTRIVFDGYSLTSRSLFGVIENSNRFGITGTVSGNDIIVRFDYAQTLYSPIVLLKERRRYELDKNVAKIDGQVITTFTLSAVSLTLNEFLFARNFDGTSGDFATGKCYSCQIYDNTTLVRDFIPAVRLSDGEAGLYDLVNDVFYTNQGTGKFKYGKFKNIPDGYAQVDLETLEWHSQTSTVVYADFPLMKNIIGTNLYCSKYETTTIIYSSESRPDKSISGRDGYSSTRIYIKDSDFDGKTTSEIATMLSNVWLLYLKA